MKTMNPLSRNDAVGSGERDRPGRSSRRPADCIRPAAASKGSVSSCRGDVFGGTPKTAGGTPALPQAKSAASRRAFTLIEMLVVIAIIAILAALIAGLNSSASEAKVRSRVKTELKQLEGAIEAYHKKYGFYPPGNGDGNYTGTNQLFYELTGTETAPPANDVYMDFLNTPISSAEALTRFKVKGFVNSGPEKQNFLSNLKPSGYAAIPGSQAPVRVLTVPYKGPAGDFNPWHYDSSSPENNTESYDLWAKVVLKGKTVTIGNWKD